MVRNQEIETVPAQIATGNNISKGELTKGRTNLGFRPSGPPDFLTKIEPAEDHVNGKKDNERMLLESILGRLRHLDPTFSPEVVPQYPYSEPRLGRVTARG